jgi:hypothetical protein
MEGLKEGVGVIRYQPLPGSLSVDIFTALGNPGLALI